MALFTSCRSPIRRILDLLANVTPSGADNYSARCPNHHDRHASLSVSEGDDGRVLLYCHAGRSTEEVVRSLGLKMSDLFPSNSNSSNGRAAAIASAGRISRAPGKTKAPPKPKTPSEFYPTCDDALEAQDRWMRQKYQGRRVGRWDFKDED